MINALRDLTSEQLERALELRREIDALQAQLDRIQGTVLEAPVNVLAIEAAPTRGKKRFSAAARRAMREAQRARRAAERGDSIAPAKKVGGKRKRKPMTAA